MKKRLVGISLITAATGVFLLGRIILFALEPESNEQRKYAQRVYFQHKPVIKGYTCNMKQLIEQTKKNLEKVNQKLEERECDRRDNEDREQEIREHIGIGNILYEGGRLKEAREEWEMALGLAEDPETKAYIKRNMRGTLVGKRTSREEYYRDKQERFKATQREKRRQRAMLDELTRQEALLRKSLTRE